MSYGDEYTVLQILESLKRNQTSSVCTEEPTFSEEDEIKDLKLDEVVEMASNINNQQPSKSLKVGKSQSDIHRGKKRKSVKGKDGDENGKWIKRKKADKAGKWFGIRARSSPHQLFVGIRKLKKKQREAVRVMGFGRLLSFNVDGIPSKLGHYVVDVLDPKKMQLDLGRVKIDVNKEAVHKIMGISQSGLDLCSTERNKTNDTVREEWKRRYAKPLIGPTDVVNKIVESDDDDSIFFKLDFLILFFSTMIECHKNGKCRLGVLDCIRSDTNLRNIDWCGCIVNSIKKCKAGWKRRDVQSFFTGPLTILTLLYVDSIRCPGFDDNRLQTPIAFWSKEKLSLRQNIEIRSGGFGMGEVRDLFDEGNVDKTIANGYAGGHIVDEAHPVKANGVMVHIAKLEELYQMNLKGKRKFEREIRDAFELYPEANEMKDIMVKYKALYKETVEFSPANNEEHDEGGNIDSKSDVNEQDPKWTKFWVEHVDEIENYAKSKGVKDESIDDATERIKDAGWSKSLVDLCNTLV